MTTEIELKFIVTKQAITALPQFLSQWSCEYGDRQNLLNTYYETDDCFLRLHDMGLRIRSFDDSHEMTLKTSGKVIAGLHQRPEYNISLSEAKLTLSLLPHDVWPENCDIAKLEQQLKPLFSTHFVREKWLVTYESSEIELALDRGEIKSGESVESLNEIELELKQGDISDILAFAQQFSELGGLRLSSQSKAARGYQLAQQQNLKVAKAFSILHVAEKSTVEQALQQAIEIALAHWQYHEDLWVSGNKNAKHSVLFAILVLRQIWAIWGKIIPRKATAKLREQLQQIETLIIDHDLAEEIVYQAIYTQTKLALTQWIINKQWLIYTDKAEHAQLNGSFKRFADVMLSRTAKTLKNAFSHRLTEKEFKNLELSLRKQTINFLLLAGAYSDETTIAYIEQWQSVLYAIEQSLHVDKDKMVKQALDQPLFWLNSSQH